MAPRLEYRRRARPSGTSDYALFDTRVGRRLSRVLELFVEGTNLFDVTYEEIAGVRMPGAAMAVGVRFGG
jgi:outer membrane receptor protein involved in Fe transport